MVAAAIVAGSAISAGSSLLGGSQVAGAGAQYSSYLQSLLQQIQSQVQPWISAGQYGVNTLAQLMGSGGGNPLSSYLLAPFNPTQQELNNQPSYQYALAQGQLGVTNSAAARGLANSGQALAGAANYASGAAQTNYQTAFNNYWTNRMNAAQLLGGLSNAGETATGQLVSGATGVGVPAANVGFAGAQGGASGIVGAGNALAGGATSYGTINALQGLLTGSNNGMYANNIPGATPNQVSSGAPGGAMGF